MDDKEILIARGNSKYEQEAFGVLTCAALRMKANLISSEKGRKCYSLYKRAKKIRTRKKQCKRMVKILFEIYGIKPVDFLKKEKLEKQRKRIRFI